MKDSKIIDYFWQALGGAPKVASTGLVIEVKTWQALAQGGFLAKQTSEAEWQQAWESLKVEATGRRLTAKDLDRFRPLLYQGPIKAPFQPQKLSPGPRPQAWLNGLYQKVLRFETTLIPIQWQELINTEILPNFSQGEDILVNEGLQQYLQGLLKDFPSLLRKLELWISAGAKPLKTLTGKAKTKPPKPQSPSPPQAPQDAFKKVSATEPHIKQVEKPYYQVENKPALGDQETLEFLDSLEDLESDEEI